MTQTIKQADIFGRVGSGFGKGLAEQVPKEIERNRLSSGLEDLNKQNLSPRDYFTKALGVPGLIDRPQVVQSLENLTRQQARGQALAQQNAPKPSPFPQNQTAEPGQQQTSNVPSLTKEEPFAKAQEGFIPRTEDEKFETAGQKYNANPAFYGNDPQKAIDYENQSDATNTAIANANQTKHQNLSAIQDNVVKRLNDQSDRLNTKVPADLYSKIEDKAIQATKPKKEGGRGLTEQQAMKEYGEELDDASRSFDKIKEIGNWGISFRPASETLRSMKELQNQMEKLDQTDNYAKKLISDNGLSPKLSYAIAQPVSRVPALNSFIKNLPRGKTAETIAETVYDIPGTLKIAPELALYVEENEKASPLAIAHEIEKKGYDGSAFLQYLTDHSDALNLRKRQSEQATTPVNLVKPWNDMWLSSFTGIQ